MEPDREIKSGIGRRSLYRGVIAGIDIKIGREIVEGTPEEIRDALAKLWMEASVSLREFVEKKTGEDHSILTDIVAKAVAVFNQIPIESEPRDPDKVRREYEDGIAFVRGSLARGKISQETADHFAGELERLKDSNGLT
ncbi:MAG: hypothetical protein ABL949_13570 [Fimbriimonadaceae bacterium]